MRVSKIVVENYRSILRVEIALSRFSIFVGQNNHGKTNLFEAIDWFYSSSKSSPTELHHKMDNTSIISVELHYEDVEAMDIEKLSSANATKISNLLAGQTSFMVKKTSEDHKRAYFINGENKGNPTGIDPAINEFIPKLEYVNTKIRIEDFAQYKEKNPIGQMLSGVLAAIISESEDYKNFREQFERLFENEDSEVRKSLNQLASEVSIYLKKQFPGDVDVRFQVNPPEFTDLLKSFDTTVDDGVLTKAQDKGDGMQRAIMLSIIQAFADFRKRQLVGSSFFFLIDEAELHLHPSAQRLLKQALLEISATDQVMLNTHSSVLVVDDHERQKLFCVEKNAQETSIEPTNEIDKVNIVFELLGGSPHDLLLPRNFLIVEGKSDYVFLTQIVKAYYQDEFQGIKILFSGGDMVRQAGSIDAIDLTLRPLVGQSGGIYKDHIVVLLDKPNNTQQSNYVRFKEGYPYLFSTGRVFELPHCSLEECYPDPWKRTVEEVAELGNTVEAKVKLAKDAAAGMSKEVFEEEMALLLDTLKKCQTSAFTH